MSVAKRVKLCAVATKDLACAIHGSSAGTKRLAGPSSER